MPTASNIALMVTALALVGLLVAEQRNAQRGVALSKPIASLGLVALAWSLGALEWRYGQTVLLGLIACTLGDLLLIPRGAGRAFLAGMASFALGHAAYAAAFMPRGVDATSAAITAVGMALVAFGTLRWLGPRLPLEMRLPIRGYIAIISVMVVLAVGASVATGEPLMATGALAFAASDLAVARERFVQAGFVNQLWGLPMYYGAQLVLAFSAAL